MSDYRDAISDALEQAYADLGNTADDAVRSVEERPAPVVRHPVRAEQAPPPPAVRTREGRFNPATMVCVYCNVPQHEHGRYCGRDDYSEWQRHLLESAKCAKHSHTYEQIKQHTTEAGGVVAAAARARRTAIVEG